MSVTIFRGYYLPTFSDVSFSCLTTRKLISIAIVKLVVSSLQIETLYITGIGIYIAVMLIIGYYSAKITRTSEDYIVAGRRLPLWLATATLFATWFGGGTALGGAGTAFAEGIWNTEDAWGVIPDPFGAGLCLVLAGLFYMHWLRKMRLLTLADFYLVRFGKTAQTIAAILMIPTYIFWLAVQIIAFGKVFQAIMGWPYETSILISVLVIIIYTFMGGLWAVSLTDFVQMLILVVGIGITSVYAVIAAGGIQALPAEKFQFFPTVNTFDAWLAWIGAWMIIGLGSIPTPDLMQRAFASKDEKTAKYSAVFAGIMYWTLGFLPVLVGIAGVTLAAKGLIPSEPLEEDPELVLPLVVKYIVPPAIGVIILGALLAAIMSSADSALLAPATVLAKNILKDLIKPDISDRGLLWASRIGVIIIALLALGVGLTYPYVYELMAFSFDLILAALFASLTLGIYWKKTNEIGAIAGMIAGILFRVIAAGIVEGFTFEGVTYPLTWYYYTVGSPIVATIVTVIVSLATQRINPPKPLTTLE